MLLPHSKIVFSTQHGRVETFDESKGLGTVRLADGTDLPFHCISIADGSRTISEGTSVSCAVAFRVKRIEAIDIKNR